MSSLLECQPESAWLSQTKSRLIEILGKQLYSGRPRLGGAFITERLECYQLPLSSDWRAIDFLVSLFKGPMSLSREY